MDVYAEPEAMIAALNRKRQLKMFAAIGGLTLGLTVLLFAAAAMYNQTPEAANEPAVAAESFSLRP